MFSDSFHCFMKNIHKKQTYYTFSADFINSLILHQHLLINSDFLFKRIKPLKCFKSHNASVKHDLQTPTLRRQLTTNIMFYLIQSVSPSSFNFQMSLDCSILLLYSLSLKSLVWFL